jgi:hypothetical protein
LADAQFDFRDSEQRQHDNGDEALPVDVRVYASSVRSIAIDDSEPA